MKKGDNYEAEELPSWIRIMDRLLGIEKKEQYERMERILLEIEILDRSSK